MRRLLLGGLLLAFVAVSGFSLPQPEKGISARRCGEKIRVDGRLDERVWQEAGRSDFVQQDPADGGEPSEKTTFWVVFDEEALYVAARLEDRQPQKIVGLLGRRDDLTDSDWFHLSLDPLRDRRSGFTFSVNPAGSIADCVLYNDAWTDYSWDGIWEARAERNDHGWSLEMKIPFDQLRFPRRAEMLWGLNVQRVIMHKKEKLIFSWAPKEDPGVVSNFAVLEGLSGVRSHRGLELLPYATAQLNLQPEQPGDPFLAKSEFAGNAGLDLKLGLKQNVTLDVTLNPDFGQVEVDPAEVNLTAFELYYSEKRPFFIEGASIFSFGRGGATDSSAFDWQDPEPFYSRRIGRPPQGSLPSAEFSEQPGQTTILTAAKLTGKSAGWNFGALAALTARERGSYLAEEGVLEQTVEPAAGYLTLRTQKEFSQGRQGLGVIASSVWRDMSGSVLETEMARSALTVGVDGWTFLDRKDVWVFTGWLAGSSVAGSSGAISALQRAPLHYFQRPDVDYLGVDENATSLSGWAGRLRLHKERGRTIFDFQLGAQSPGFDCTETGFQFTRADRINGHIMTGYYYPHPGRWFQNWVVWAAAARSYDFGGNLLAEEYAAAGDVQLRNYWNAGVMLFHYPAGHFSDTLTRGGPLTWVPQRNYAQVSLSSDSRRRAVLSFSVAGWKNTAGGDNMELSSGVRFKAASRLSLSFSATYGWGSREAQWVGDFADPLQQATYGTRYVFGELVQKALASEIRLDWIFTPRMSLQVYLQPYIAVGGYGRFKELARGRSYDFLVYGLGNSTINESDGLYTVDPDGLGPAPAFSFFNPDFNFKSLRGTAVFRYEFRPGSAFYLVWTQDRNDFANPGDFRIGRDLSDMFAAPGRNVFMIKVSHRLKI